MENFHSQAVKGKKELGGFAKKKKALKKRNNSNKPLIYLLYSSDGRFF